MRYPASENWLAACADLIPRLEWHGMSREERRDKDYSVYLNRGPDRRPSIDDAKAALKNLYPTWNFAVSFHGPDLIIKRLG